MLPRGGGQLVGANGAGNPGRLCSEMTGGTRAVPRDGRHRPRPPAFHDLVLNTMVAASPATGRAPSPPSATACPTRPTSRSRRCARASSTPLSAMASTATRSRGASRGSATSVSASRGCTRSSDGQRRRAQRSSSCSARRSAAPRRGDDRPRPDGPPGAAHILARGAPTLRGVTVVYSTHIFDGLDDWLDTILHLAHGKVRYAGAAAAAPRAAATAESPQASGSLFHMAPPGRLREERDARRAAAAVPDVAGCPTTDEASTRPPRPRRRARSPPRRRRASGASSTASAAAAARGCTRAESAATAPPPRSPSPASDAPASPPPAAPPALAPTDPRT